ncbi:fimbrial biogenesis outer membrane usher protein [Rahnella aquatilis]|nr:fimbrial biogenesis outer membrane usher protein [Rahnella aquatilis]
MKNRRPTKYGNGNSKAQEACLLPPNHPRISRFRPRPMVVALCLSGLWGTSSQAQDYFDPAFLDDGSGTKVDLSAYATAGAIPEGTYLVDVYLNQQMNARRQVRFAKDSKGDVVPDLTPAMLKDMGVATARIPAFSALAADKPVGDLKSLIPDATIAFSMAKLRLDITVPQVNMDEAVAGQIDPKLWDQGVPAMIMGYNLSGSKNWVDASNGSSGSDSQSLFGSVNGGANLGAWRLRSTLTANSYQNNGGGYNSSSSNSQFSNTYVQRDVERLQSYLTAGETSSGGDVFDSIPFRGVKMVSTEDMLPSSLRGFAPVITGTAKSTARVTVEQNGSTIYETTVPPGPFRLTDIVNASNGGNLVVTITEADGSKHGFTQPYSSLPVMKRPGSASWEVTAGRYQNGGYSEDSRDPIFGLATVAVGLSNLVTLYGGVLGANVYQAISGGLGVSLGDFGAISVDATMARAQIPGQDGDANGGSFRARYSKSMTETGTTVDLSAYRYSTSNYYSFSDAMSAGFDTRDGYAPWASSRPRSSWQANVSQALGTIGSLFLRATRDEYWGASSRVVNSMSAGFSSSVKGVGYSVNYDVDHTSEKDGDSWPTNRQVSLNVNVPFSLFGPVSPALSSMSANYSMNHDNAGRVSQQAGVSGSALDSRLSWGASGNTDNQDSGQSGNVNLGWQGERGSSGMSYGFSRNTRTLSGNTSGGLVIHPHGVTMTGVPGDTMALVEAPGADSVRVMNGNSVTDGRGYGVATSMQAYQRNVISLDPTTLPDGVDIQNNSVVVYPTRGALVEAKFKTRVGRQAMLTLNVNGKPVPFGAMASLVGGDADSGEDSATIVGDSGMLYVSGVPQKGTLKVQWGNDADQQCKVNYDLGELPTVKDKNALSVVQQTLTCQPDATPSSSQAEPSALAQPVGLPQPQLEQLGAPPPPVTTAATAPALIQAAPEPAKPATASPAPATKEKK